MNRPELLNGIALAYIGDAVYEVAVRDHLLEKGLTRPNDLQKNAVRYVSAKAQASLISEMEADNFLTEVEQDIFKRGRNAHSKTSAKNTDVITYRISTGFEAVIGFLHLTMEADRLQEVMEYCLLKVDEKNS
ncbi:Mini-ribonuclease 3 [Lactococcus termiticola]|uniref:Mini-ribonuclease 3 n=1 Tax=Lactococcus termiticola TaxID=2169526 RepID=A0A2R5HKD4_9LACT|nr:Mini-ribonuclease 3 [Lactococcus termiticola]GBG96991.1 mini-ribonuclease 3 [Lactococcus termiticola]